jgi:hypothetical protein
VFHVELDLHVDFLMGQSYEWSLQGLQT